MKNYLIFSLFFSAALFGFNAPVKADAAYDLKAESLVMNSAGCEANQVCVFTARVKNLGGSFAWDFPLNANASSANYQNDTPISVSPARGAVIKTNDYITFTIYGKFAKIGPAALNFSLDAAGYLSESDTNNNSASLGVSVTGYDLAVESITILPASPMIKQDCYIEIKVKNNSSHKLYSEAGLNLIKTFPDFSQANASSTSPSLAKAIDLGGYLYYGYEGKFTAAGEKQLSFTVDPDDVLKESDLTNNSQNIKVTVYNPADADLAIDSVSFSAAKIILGEPLDIDVKIKNIGKASLTNGVGLAKNEFNYQLPYFDYGINYPAADNYPTLSAPLNPGKIFHYKFRGFFNRPGNFNLDFLINKGKQLVEAGYGNNATTTPVAVYKNLADADSFSVLTKSVSFASSTAAIISWTTDVKTAGRVNYNLAHNNVNDNQAEAANSALEHAVTLNNLKPGENYIYAITAKNGTVEKTELISNFTMPENNAARITAGPSVVVNNKTAVVSWTTNLLASGRVYYRKSGAAEITTAGKDGLAASHNVELKDLAIGSYDYFVSSTSTPGTNVKTGWANFEVKAAATTTPANTVVASNNSAAAISVLPVADSGLYNRLKGKIILQVQDQGQAYYVSPKEKTIYYLGRPADAFQVIRAQGIGASNSDLAKIPLGLENLSGADADHDSLPDALEDAIGADKNKADTDGDGYKDKEELAVGYSPLAKGAKMNYDLKFSVAQKGRIFLQTQGKGEAWYVNPADGKRYFLSRPADAFSLMRGLGAGVANKDWQTLTGLK